MDYRRRSVDDVLDGALVDLAAIAIEGAQGVGKTATASRRAHTILSLNDPRIRRAVSDNCDLITEVDPPVFIDEWQLEPSVWERVRQAVGALFESLAVQSVRVYAEALGAHVGHLRTKGGDHEVDIIVETPDRRCIAVEVKVSDNVTDHDVRHLNWLSEQIGDRLTDRIVVNTGPYAYRRRDGVAVVPLALLGP